MRVSTVPENIAGRIWRNLGGKSSSINETGVVSGKETASLRLAAS